MHKCGFYVQPLLNSGEPTIILTKVNKSINHLNSYQKIKMLDLLVGKNILGKNADNPSVTKDEFTACFQLYDDGIVRLIYAGDEARDNMYSIKCHTPLLCW